MAADERWYFSKDQLANTPSRRCGYDVDKELSYRQQAANFIQDMGQRLLVTQLCINTAIVYMHRFYVFHSFTQFHRNAMAAASLFLAAKVEEQPRKLEHVIKVAHLCLHRDQAPLDTKSEAYLEQAQDLVFNENVLLQTLGFDVAIDHPHTHVVRCCHLVRASKDLAQTSYFMASNSLHLTTMCLQYKPTVVACFCIHLACKWSNWEIPQSNEGKDWFWYVDKSVSLDQLEQLTAEFLVIFDKCPTKLKHKIKSISATQNTSVPPSVSGSPFDSEPRRVRPPGNDGSSLSSSGSQDPVGSALFRSSTSSSNVGSNPPLESVSSGNSWIPQHLSSGSLPSVSRDQVSTSTQQLPPPPPPPPPPLPPPPPPPPPPPTTTTATTTTATSTAAAAATVATAGTYRDYREKKERERQEREKFAQTASGAVSSSRDGHHHHHHHHHGVPPSTATSSHHKPASSSSGIPHNKLLSVPQSTSSGLMSQQLSSSSSSRPPPGVTAARDAARREAAHARDASRRRNDPYGYRPTNEVDTSFEPPLNHWSHTPEDNATDPRHRDKDRHSTRLPPPPPLSLPPPPPPPPQPPVRTKEISSHVSGGLPDLGSTMKSDHTELSKHLKQDSFVVKVEPDAKTHAKVDSNSNSSYLHSSNVKQESVETKHGKVDSSNSVVSSSNSNNSNNSGSNISSSGSSSRHRPRLSETFSEGSRYDGRPRTATPPKLETSNGKSVHASMLAPSASLVQQPQLQSSRTPQQSQVKRSSSPPHHHHHHHHHRARSPHMPSQPGGSSMKPPAGANIASKSSYYPSSKNVAAPEVPARNGTAQHEEITAAGSSGSSSNRRNTLRTSSTTPEVELSNPSSPTNVKSSCEKKTTSNSTRESPYGQRSKRQRTPPSASKKVDSSTPQQTSCQISLADLGTPPPPPPPPVALLSPFGSPPAAPSVASTGAPATPGKSVTSTGRSRLRTSSSSSEPELVPLVTKLDDIEGFQNIGNSMSIRLPDVAGRLPDTRVPELITPFRDTATAVHGNGITVSASTRLSTSQTTDVCETNKTAVMPSQQTSQMLPKSSTQSLTLSSSQNMSSQQLTSQQSSADLGAVAFPSPATHAAVDPDEGLFGSSNSTVLDVVMSEQLPSLDRMLDPGVHLTTDVTTVRKPGDHHHKSDKKKKKEKHRRKEKDKEREKEKEKSPHKVHKLKHKKEKHKEKSEGPGISGLGSTTFTGPASASAPIKITIPKDKLNLSLDPPHSVVPGSSSTTSTPSTGLKLKIQKDRLKVPDTTSTGSTATTTSSTTPGGKLKIKISMLSGATPGGASVNKDSKKRDRTSPRGDQPPSKQPRVDGSSSSSRRSASSGSYNKQNGVPSGNTSSTQSQQSSRGSNYTANKVPGKMDHSHHHPSHPARSRSSVNTTSSQSTHHSHHQYQ